MIIENVKDRIINFDIEKKYIKEKRKLMNIKFKDNEIYQTYKQYISDFFEDENGIIHFLMIHPKNKYVFTHFKC